MIRPDEASDALDLSHRGMGGARGGLVAAMLPALPNIKRLSLRNNRFKGTTIEAFLRPVAALVPDSPAVVLSRS